MARRTLALLSLSALAAIAWPAHAEVYTVTLKNGSTFLTRYQPREAAWDRAKVTFMTDLGNAISLPKNEIAAIASESENRGFGRAINSTTVEMGMAPNDAADPNSPGPGGQGNTADAVMRALQAGAGQQPVYNMHQFVEPNALGGMPLGWTQPQTTPPMGGVIINTAPAPRPPQQ